MSDEQKVIGYCFKCREKHEVLEPKAEWAANGSPGTRGTCANCGGTIYKAGRTPAHENLPKPEIKITRKAKKGKKSTKKKNGKEADQQEPPFRQAGGGRIPCQG